jgi:hypothetical protein
MVIFSSAGWSETGGPWVQFELAQPFKARAITLSSRGAIPFGRRSELARAGRRDASGTTFFRAAAMRPQPPRGRSLPQKNAAPGVPGAA